MCNAENYALEMNHIKKSFSGVVVLEQIDFRLQEGSVHALVGENGAGKSTLMKILSGLYKAEQGEILLKGKKVDHLDPQKSLDMGISMIHQELSPIPHMTVAENVFLGREPSKSGFINFKKMKDDTRKILESLNIHISPSEKMSQLSTAATQMVEIAKAISRDAQIIIMDEPTSSLTSQEAHVLFEQVEKLKKKGISIIYITHKMDEIFQLADYVSILRDGRIISSGPKSEYSMDRIISEMVGRELNEIYPQKEAVLGETLMEVKGLSSKGRFKNISFSVKSGEIIGFAGLVGAGRTEVMRALFGLDKHDSGEIYLESERLYIRNCTDAIKKGIVMASEDRKREGLILCRSVRENSMLSNLDLIKNGPFISPKKEKSIVQDMIKKLRVKTDSMDTRAINLSGGNQQKLVLIKWLLRDIKVLILDEPTRGIDVGAKYEIYKLMRELAAEGKAIIMVSSELSEIIGMSDRIVIMNEGRITGELVNENISQEDIMKLAV